MTVIDSDGADRVADYVAEIGGFKTQFDVFRFMKRLTERYGARAFMVLNLPPATSLDLSSNSIITNWPADLISEYDQEALLSTSPIVTRLRTATAPFTYDVDYVTSRRDERTMGISRSLFARYRMPRGAYFPVHDSSGMRGAVSLAGDRTVFSPTEMMELMYLSVHVYNRLAEIRELDNRATDMLTEREIDCLNWTAAGKTSVEIAEILGLSEHTINHYLNRATKKLDTVNRTQAVAKALRLGLIK
ncbi:MULTISPECIES: LuxR family transcriptional regulator [Alphaproteobacteria]|uniref:LuxR family transcriptional regulator n=2 Tax=Alphaproteobacteria TaxID=28211 RepID=A0A512HI17_9HYPH|nr:MULTISPECIES: autoinducer binding domain-containing protein [Alphaproteobacteria]GEO85087.1 LuxR family transcriptional regulator [Ciceribacter naphthalenivorans]GLR24579.1 LuxR family transcriptional regulator [Ciceribacter naphthalenivorans]GLT07435.1 LuxR family transcriptional regulator [Sphingomonas psychrolutea]